MEPRRWKAFSRVIFTATCLLCFDGGNGQDVANSFDGRRKFKSRQCNDSTLREIPTPYGTFTGKRVEVTGDLCPVVQFLGIPYAKPPVNGRRWKKPEKLPRKDGPQDATVMGAVCPQNLDGTLPKELLPIWYKDAKDYMNDIASKMSEDCLYLNIYVPMELYANETLAPGHYSNTLPVMVYIHGHTFMEGSGNFYDGSVLASYGKVIVVTINYRLGVLGFMSILNKSCPGNFGLWDQIRALEWISENIAKFGGDPTRVTLFGSGAGAASINLLMITVQVDNTFHRVILQSGSALSSWTIVKDPASNTRRFANHPKLNCSQTSSGDKMNCLRSKHWKDLIDVEIRPPRYTLAFGPVIDGELLKDRPEKLMIEGEFMNYPMMLGVSQGDGYGFIKNLPSHGYTLPGLSRSVYERNDFQVDVDSVVDRFYRDAGEGKGILRRIIEYVYTDRKQGTTSATRQRSLLELLTDKQWLEPAAKTAAMSLECAYTVYFYTLFHRAGKSKNVPEWLAAGHGDEVPLVFGYPYNQKKKLFSFNYTKIDRMVSAGMMTYWTNFAKAGNPMSGSKQKTEFISGYPNMFETLHWPAYDKAGQRSLNISANPSIQDHYRSRQVAFWKNFLPDLLTEAGRAFPFMRKSTTISPPVASLFIPARTTKTSVWTPIAPFRTVPVDFESEFDKGENGPISLQLTTTVVVGSVLLFANIAAFVIVTYHKGKDKFKIEKLEAQYEEKKRNLEEQLKRLGVVGGGGNGYGHESHSNSYKDEDKAELGAPFTSMSTFADQKSPIKVLPTAVLPELKPYTFRDDSLTSTSAEDQSRPSKRKPFNKYRAYQSSVDGSPASMLVCNSKEELSIPHVTASEYQTSGRMGDYPRMSGGGRLNPQQTNFTTPELKYKTYDGRHAVPGAVQLNGVDRVGDVTNRPNSLWSVVSSVAHGVKAQKFNTASRINKMQSKGSFPSGIAHGSHVLEVHSNPNQENDMAINDPVRTDRECLPRDVSCGSKSALLPSLVDKSKFRSDTSESETDRTGSSMRSDAVGSYCVTNNKTMNVMTKL